MTRPAYGEVSINLPKRASREQEQSGCALMSPTQLHILFLKIDGRGLYTCYLIVSYRRHLKQRKEGRITSCLDNAPVPGTLKHILHCRRHHLSIFPITTAPSLRNLQPHHSSRGGYPRSIFVSFARFLFLARLSW